MKQGVDGLLGLSWSLDEEIRRLMESARPPTTPRGIAAAEMCWAAMQHGASQRILISAGCGLTAMALASVHYESVVRSLWVQLCATDDWIEPVPGPPVASMLDRVDAMAPPFIGAELRRLKKPSWQAKAALPGPRPAEEFVAVLKNANCLALLNAQAYALACSDATLGGCISRLQASHRECFA